MRVVSYTAHNVLRISDIEFDLAGRNLFVVGGRNGQGKTSALKALLVALCGRSGMDYPEVLLKDGEDKGWVKVELSGDDELQDKNGFTVELYLRRKRGGEIMEEFRIVDSDGDEAPEPRTLLKRLCATRGFDPLAFERLDKKQRRNTLQSIVGLDFTLEKNEQKKFYNQRTDVNRDLARLKSKISGMPRWPEAPKQPIVLSELLDELDRRRKQGQDNGKTRSDHEAAQKSLSEAERDIITLRSQLVDLQSQLDDAVTARDMTQGKVAGLTERVSQLVEPNVDEIKVLIKEAETINAKVRQNQEFTAIDREYGAAEDTVNDLTEKMLELDEKMQSKLKAAEWPVEGLSIDDEGVLYNGLPFEQASKSQRVLASVKIGMALNPKLRLLVCQDGNDLDTDSMAELQKLLEENDFQMLVEVVTRTDADEDLCAVVIRDGEVAKPAEELEVAATA